MKPTSKPDHPRVLIGTPTATGDVSARYMTSVFALLVHLRSLGMDADVELERGGWVALARNMLATKALNREYTHLWFIDADESFVLSEAMKVWVGMEHGRRQGEWSRHVVGAFYPRKRIDWDEAARQCCAGWLPTGGQLRDRMLQDTWSHVELGPVGTDEIVSVDWLPTGFLLLDVDECLRVFRDKTPGLAYFDREYGASHAFFTNQLLPAEKGSASPHAGGVDYCGEDVTFSRIWRKIGGKLWEVKGVEIRHEGRMVF